MAFVYEEWTDEQLVAHAFAYAEKGKVEPGLVRALAIRLVGRNSESRETIRRLVKMLEDAKVYD